MLAVMTITLTMGIDTPPRTRSTGSARLIKRHPTRTISVKLDPSKPYAVLQKHGIVGERRKSNGKYKALCGMVYKGNYRVVYVRFGWMGF